MAFQIETGSGSDRSTNYRDHLAKMVRMWTSRHVATAAVNAAGTGYAVGDLITINDAVFTAAQHLEFVAEVTAISGGGGTGPVTALRIYSSGAYAQQALSATISTAGTGYAVDDILQLQGGSSRLPAKAVVTGVSAGGVTSVSFAEPVYAGDGSEPGVYATTPSNPVSTVGVGNADKDGTLAYAGNDDCELTVTWSPIPTTLTARPTTAKTGAGTGLTIDVTFAESGWAVDERDRHDFTINSVTNERIVVLVGDATGYTNKPFIAYITGSHTSGLKRRFSIACFGLIAHNPALPFDQQQDRSPNWDGANLLDGGSFLNFGEDPAGATFDMTSHDGAVDECDFWFSVNDLNVTAIMQILESATISDDGIYWQHYAGYLDRIGTEVEAPYPMFIFGSSRSGGGDPQVGATNITSIAENRHGASGCGWYWDSTSSVWRDVVNDDTSGTPNVEQEVMLPIGRNFCNTSDQNLNIVIENAGLWIIDVWFELDRSSATRVFRKIPGNTVDKFFLWPLTIMQKQSSASAAEDNFVGNVRNIFWTGSDDGTGNRITNFSEDYIEIGSDRYIAFHNHVHTEPYQYIVVKWDT